MEIIKITKNNINLLQQFLDLCETEQQSFRYFKNREINAIDNHIITIVLKNENQLIGYGHLDKDNSDVWLGIMINNQYSGKGFGELIMKFLTDFYSNEIKLSVDKNNAKAINLYFKTGFTIISQNDYYFIMSNKKTVKQ